MDLSYNPSAFSSYTGSSNTRKYAFPSSSIANRYSKKYLLDQEEYPSRNVQPCANCKGITFLSLRPPLYPESGNKKEIRVQKTEEKIIATSYRRRSATPELTKAISSFKIIENMIKSSSSNVSTKSKPLFLP